MACNSNSLVEKEIMKISRVFIAAIVILLLGRATPAAPQQKNPPQEGSASYNAWLTREVRHQLLLVPWYSVFDNLEYFVNDYTVTLEGLVANESDRNVANIRANTVANVFSMTNNLKVKQSH